MKKIVSILCVLAVLCSMLAISVNAANDNCVYLTQTLDEETNTLTLSMYLNSTENVGTLKVFYNAAALISGGAVFKSSSATAGATAGYSTRNGLKALTVSCGSTLNSGTETWIASYVFDIAALEKDSYDVDYISAQTKLTDETNANITAHFSYETLTINTGGDEPAGNKMVALVDTGAVDTLNDDGWQKGQGIAATFNVADIKDFTAMNWVLTCENIAAPKYAKVDNFAELIAAIGEESTVQFVATFVVNAIENEVETVYAIKDVAAGFKPVEGEPVIFTAE